MRKFYLVLSIGILFTSCYQKHPALKPGFRSFREFDNTRSFDTTSRNSARYFRPVMIDVFYPGTGNGTALSYGDILDQYEKRMDYTISDDSSRKTSLMIINLFGEYLKMDSPLRILQHPLTVQSSLEFAKQKFPLIIYASGMNGSTWENVLLFEKLTSKGYVVASVSSVGKFPGFMSTAEDIEEQVKDILFTINRMKQFEFIDSTNIGILSWSLGGTSAVKASMSSKEIKCMLSMDGTETHYYGRDKSWDSMFNVILTIPPYKPADLRIPYCYLSSDRTGKHDSVYNFRDQIPSADKYYLQFVGGIHEDFSSLPAIAKSVQPSLQNINSTFHSNIQDIATIFFGKYLKSETRDLSMYLDSLHRQDASKYIGD